MAWRRSAQISNNQSWIQSQNPDERKRPHKSRTKVTRLAVAASCTQRKKKKRKTEKTEETVRIDRAEEGRANDDVESRGPRGKSNQCRDAVKTRDTHTSDAC